MFFRPLFGKPPVRVWKGDPDKTSLMFSGWLDDQHMSPIRKVQPEKGCWPTTDALAGDVRPGPSAAGQHPSNMLVLSFALDSCAFAR